MRLLVCLLSLALSSSAFGQGVVNPTKVEFDASPDHATVLTDGRPAVTSYTLRITLKGAASPTAPITSIDLGKPVPDATGHISVTPPVLIGLPLKQEFTAIVAAIGPLGEGVSEPSNPFQRAATPGPPTHVLIR